ncbi:MAG: hypothetical protein ACLFWD_03580 [Anaerolineales bacterium]
MSEERPVPDLDRLSTLAALILLAFALARIIQLPSLELDVSVFNLLIPLTINTRSIMLMLAALLSVVGADWLVQSHPQPPTGRRAVERWILPGLTALGIGSLLTRLSEGWPLWIGLVMTTLLLLGVFLAEYLTINPEDPRRVAAASGLELLAYVLVLGTAFTFRLMDIRVIFLAPASFAASAFVAWRLFRLRMPQTRSLVHAAVAGWGFSQLAVSLQYWPLPPVQGSLLLILYFYLAVSFLGEVLRGRMNKGRGIELSILGTLGVAAILLLA